MFKLPGKFSSSQGFIAFLPLISVALLLIGTVTTTYLALHPQDLRNFARIDEEGDWNPPPEPPANDNQPPAQGPDDRGGDQQAPPPPVNDNQPPAQGPDDRGGDQQAPPPPAQPTNPAEPSSNRCVDDSYSWDYIDGQCPGQLKPTDIPNPQPTQTVITEPTAIPPPMIPTDNPEDYADCLKLAKRLIENPNEMCGKPKDSVVFTEPTQVPVLDSNNEEAKRITEEEMNRKKEARRLAAEENARRILKELEEQDAARQKEIARQNVINAASEQQQEYEDQQKKLLADAQAAQEQQRLSDIAAANARRQQKEATRQQQQEEVARKEEAAGQEAERQARRLAQINEVLYPEPTHIAAVQPTSVPSADTGDTGNRESGSAGGTSCGPKPRSDHAWKCVNGSWSPDESEYQPVPTVDPSLLAKNVPTTVPQPTIADKVINVKDQIALLDQQKVNDPRRLKDFCEKYPDVCQASKDEYTRDFITKVGLGAAPATGLLLGPPALAAASDLSLQAYISGSTALANAPPAIQTAIQLAGPAGMALTAFECSQGNQEACSAGFAMGSQFLGELTATRQLAVSNSGMATDIEQALSLRKEPVIDYNPQGKPFFLEKVNSVVDNTNAYIDFKGLDPTDAKLRADLTSLFAKQELTYDLKFINAPMEDACAFGKGVCYHYAGIANAALEKQGIPASVSFVHADIMGNEGHAITRYYDPRSFQRGVADAWANYIDSTGGIPTFNSPIDYIIDTFINRDRYPYAYSQLGGRFMVEQTTTRAAADINPLFGAKTFGSPFDPKTFPKILVPNK